MERGGVAWTQVFVEDFKRPLTGLAVDLRGGYATLVQQSRVELPLGRPEVVWGDSSHQALPGNFVEVSGYQRDQDLDTVPVKTNAFADVGAVTDGSAGTHFEWERCLVKPTQTYIVHAPDGTQTVTGEEKSVWSIIAPDKWLVTIPERGSAPIRAASEPDEFDPPLTLKLRIPAQGKVANQIDLVPYQVHRDTDMPTLLRVATVGSRTRHLLSRSFQLNRARSLQMPPATIENLELVISQPNRYATTLGHHYYEEVIARHKESSGFLGGLFGGGHKVSREVHRIEAQTTVPTTAAHHARVTDLYARVRAMMVKTLRFGTVALYSCAGIGPTAGAEVIVQGYAQAPQHRRRPGVATRAGARRRGTWAGKTRSPDRYARLGERWSGRSVVPPPPLRRVPDDRRASARPPAGPPPAGP